MSVGPLASLAGFFALRMGRVAMNGRLAHGAER
jgi:hypothetical protein